jgi:serine protease Do
MFIRASKTLRSAAWFAALSCLTSALQAPFGPQILQNIHTAGMNPSAFAAPPPTGSLPDLVEKILPGVVNISTTTIAKTQVFGMDEFMRLWGIPQERKQTSLGSGFIIDSDGYILTNNHVIEHAARDRIEVMVTLLDKRQYRAKIIGTDEKTDIALLQIRELRSKSLSAPQNLTTVPFANSDQVRIGESVFAVGNPFGLQHTVTLGIISAKNRTIGQGPFDNFLQTDASINPGNSGGPLFNLNGEVVGINTVIFSRTGQSGGLGFAIPVNEAKHLIPDLKLYGHVRRPWLGILGERMTPQLEQYYELPSTPGVLVYNLVEGSPAERAGLQQGDIILAVGGTEVKDLYEVERALAKFKPTDSATLKVQRGRRKLELKIQLKALPFQLKDIPTNII